MSLMKKVILEKTILVAARDGFSNFPVKNVAKECGCSEGLIFHYYDTKKMLVRTCYGHICDNLSDYMQSELKGKNDFISVWKAFCDYMGRNRESALFCFGFLKSDDSTDEGLELLRDSLGGVITDEGGGQDDGRLSYLTRTLAILGCMYGSGIIRFDDGLKKDYRAIMECILCDD